jgi:acetyl esterase
MTLDPDMKAFADQTAAAGMPPDFARIGAVAARAMGDAIRAVLPPGPDMARVEDLCIDGHGCQLDARLFVPHGDIVGLIVFYHGGGWVLGSIDGYDAVCRRLAVAAGSAILSVGYRLAPEYPAPTPAQDCFAALGWADAHMETVLGGRVPIVVAGDSAGGNLAAVVALMARDRRGPKIDVQLLIYPVTDADFTTASYAQYGTGGMLTADAMKWFWSQYVADPALRVDPLISPLRAADLSGLPRAMVEIAVHDPLRDEGEAYADRLAEAGVPTVMRRWYGLCHGYIQMATILRPAGVSTDRIGADLGALLRAL